MGLYVLIGLVLASFVIAFFSARTWHWGHVIVVLGIVLSTLGFILLAAEVLRINNVYRTAIANKTKQLEDVTSRNDALRKGTKDPAVVAKLQGEQEPAIAMPENAESIPSLDDLDHEILLATRSRGRVWRKVAPAGVDQAGVKVTLQAPVSVGLAKDTVVYVFEDGPAELPAADGKPRGKQYLGEFRVKDAAGTNATLVPVLPLDQFEQQRLVASRAPWVIYETMPADRYDIFAGLSDDELKKRVPPQSVEEYIRHGKDVTTDDAAVRKLGLDETGKPLAPEDTATPAKEVYQRRLRDYAQEFEELSRRRVAMEVAKAETAADIARLTVALSTAKEMQAARESEIKRLNSDLANIQKERRAIEEHLALVKKQLARGQSLLADLLKRNSEMARQLAAAESRSTNRSNSAPSPTASSAPLALGKVK
jgi:hypothetical protein